MYYLKSFLVTKNLSNILEWAHLRWLRACRRGGTTTDSHQAVLLSDSYPKPCFTLRVCEHYSDMNTGNLGADMKRYTFKELLIFKALSSPDKAQRIHESAHVDKTTTGNSHTPWLRHTHALCACRQLLTLMTYCLVLINSSLFLRNNPLLLPLFNGSRLVLSLLTHSSE